MSSRFESGPDPRAVRRDAGLLRVSRMTRWVGVGAIALVGAIAGVVAQAKPGRSSHRSSSHRNQGNASAATDPSSQPLAPGPSVDSSGGGGGGGAGASSSGGGGQALAPPVQAPLPSTGSGGAVSGGS